MIAFLWPHLRQHAGSYSLGIVLVVSTNLILVTIPEYIQKSIDLLSDSSLSANSDQLFGYLQVMVLLAIGLLVVRTLSRICFFNPGRAIEMDIKNTMLSKLTSFSKDYYDQNSTGSLISKVNNDVLGVRLLCGFGMLQTFNILSSLSLTPWKMWQLSSELTLYCVVPLVLCFGIVRMGMKYLRMYSQARMKELQKLSDTTVTSLSAVDIIKNFGIADWASDRFFQKDAELLRRSLQLSWIRSFIMPVLNNMEALLKILVLGLGGYWAMQSQMTLGELTAFMTYVGIVTMPLTGLGWFTTLVQQGFIAIESIQTVLDQEAPLKHLKPEPALPFQQGMQIKNLTYTYPDADTPALKDLSFEIRPGQKVGVFGLIGSGKTTLVNCLNRYLICEPGHVLFEGRDVCDIHSSTLHHSIRTVSQDVFLFSDTVRANIAYGTKDGNVADEHLQELLTHSALDGEVQRFPKQENTLVGEKGIMLSGGQKQRLSLARALANPCDLLILDNVFSAVDHETERILLKNLLEHSNAQSLLLVSHRTHTMTHMDWVLVLDQGMLVDQGTHEELIQRPGVYQDTWKLQEG